MGSCLEEVPGGVLPEFARLAGSADLEAVQLALHFFATVLQELPIGPQMLESVNGIEILEEQQMRCSATPLPNNKGLLNSFTILHA